MSGKEIKIEMIIPRAAPFKTNTELKSWLDLFKKSFRIDSKSFMQKGHNLRSCGFANPDDGDLARLYY